MDLKTKERTEQKQTRVFAVKKPSLIQMSQDECKKLCDKIGVVYMPGYESRVLQYIVSSEAQDRYGDIVRATGARFENYMKNPVMFFAHNYDTPPIGNTLKAWVDKAAKQVQAWGLFLDDKVDTTGLSDLVFRMASSGFMRACSVGFMPVKVNVPNDADEAEEMGLGRWGVEFTEWDMLEWSPCGVPANPTALQNTLKDVGHRLHLTKEHVDAAAKYNVFANQNLVDQLSAFVSGKSGFVGSSGNDPVDPVEDPAPIPASAPVALSLDVSALVNVANEMKTLVDEMRSAVELVKRHCEAAEHKSTNQGAGLYNNPVQPPAASKKNLFSELSI